MRWEVTSQHSEPFRQCSRVKPHFINDNTGVADTVVGDADLLATVRGVPNLAKQLLVLRRWWHIVY